MEMSLAKNLFYTFHLPQKDVYKRQDQYKSIKSMQGHWWEDMLDFQSGTGESESLHEVNTLLEKSQYLMHSAKNMKDISHNLDELKTSGNDYLFQFYSELKSRYNPIYDKLLTQIYNPTDINNLSLIHI